MQVLLLFHVVLLLLHVALWLLHILFAAGITLLQMLYEEVVLL